MKKVAIFSVLLILGLVGSQVLPGVLGGTWDSLTGILRVLTMTALAFIMIHVGYEFDIDRKNIRQYGKDYLVAMSAAAFPWIFVSAYFLFVMLPAAGITFAGVSETLLAGRFAAPTSAGVLFAMLAAAGLSATWLFRKARILAIFDDLDTVLLMIPLKMLMVGLAWQLGVIVGVMFALLVVAWVFMHRIAIPVSWPWVIGYAVAIAVGSEILYAGSKLIDPSVPMHIEVLLPAFVLGCVLKRPAGADPHVDDAREGHQEGPEHATEQLVSTIVASVFMVLVGLSMPSILGGSSGGSPSASQSVTAAQPMMGWGMIAFHVLVVTVLSNLGKMLPAFCYRDEAGWRGRLALAIGMWPRGEVGAGVLVVSLSYGIGGPILTVAMLSLALNLVLTGFFILIVKKLLAGEVRNEAGDGPGRSRGTNGGRTGRIGGLK